MVKLEEDIIMFLATPSIGGLIFTSFLLLCLRLKPNIKAKAGMSFGGQNRRNQLRLVYIEKQRTGGSVSRKIKNMFYRI
jgi:hypothetical protein